jgi:hypothetical protein
MWPQKESGVSLNKFISMHNVVEREKEREIATASHLQTLSLELKMRAIAGVLNAAVFKACASIITEMLSKVFTVAACWRLTSDVLLSKMRLVSPTLTTNL